MTKSQPLMAHPRRSVATEGKYPKTFRCEGCGVRITLQRPWQGPPQGPQCQCSPTYWGNWVLEKAGTVELLHGAVPTACAASELEAEEV